MDLHENASSYLKECFQLLHIRSHSLNAGSESRTVHRVRWLEIFTRVSKILHEIHVSDILQIRVRFAQTVAGVRSAVIWVTSSRLWTAEDAGRFPEEDQVVA